MELSPHLEQIGLLVLGGLEGVDRLLEVGSNLSVDNFETKSAVKLREYDGEDHHRSATLITEQTQKV